MRHSKKPKLNQKKERLKAVSTKSRNIKKSNIIQLLLSILIIIFINIIGYYVYTRFDLTSEKRYSLSSSTKKMLKSLDDVVFFKIYLEGDFPAGFKRLRNESREMLDEFRAYSDYVQYEFINPNKIKNKEERFNFQKELVKKGLQPTDLHVRTEEGSSQQVIFPGVIAIYKGRELPLQLLSTQIGIAPEAQLNNSIQALEYKFANVIRNLQQEIKPRIAFIEGHGELKSIEVYDIMHTLSEFYEVERVKINGKLNSLARRMSDSSKTAFTNKYQALVIAKPDTLFGDKDKYLIDQFIMRGGKVLWLVDKVFVSMDSLQFNDNTIGLPFRLDIEDMLFKYGTRINQDLIMDVNALPIPIVTGNIGNQPQTDFLPWYFFPILTPISKHPIVNNLNAIKTEFINSIDIVGSNAIRKTVLLTTSQYSRTLTAPVMVNLNITRERPDISKYNKQFIPVAVLLEGEFESAFKFHNLNPDFTSDNEFQSMDYREKSISNSNRMIVISDGDIIKNQLHYKDGYPLPLGYDQYTQQTFGNKDFIMNAINFLLDNEGQMNMRARELKLRLLDKTKLNKNKIYWQMLNTLLPVIIIVLFGFLQVYMKKRKYAYTGK